MTIKKSQVVPLLSNIAMYSKDGQMISGLLKEKITLGTKRRLQKIQKQLISEYEQLKKDVEQIKSECKSEDQEKEIQELMNEEINLNCEKISFSQIENLETESCYDFDLLEKICE